MLNAAQATSVGRDIHQLLEAEKNDRLARIDDYLRGKHDGPYKPRYAGNEYKRLIDRCVANMLPLVVNVTAQQLYVEGYRSDAGGELGWDIWQSNGLDGRQSAVHRAALSFGTAYVTVLPGSPWPVVRGRSPRRMMAVYEDPAYDEWPVFALEVDEVRVDGRKVRRAFLWDDAYRYELRGDKLDMVGEPMRHGAPVCPVVKFADADLDGRSLGAVEPLIPMQERLDQTVFDLLMTQTFGSFKVRTITGMVAPDTTSEAEREKRKIQQDTVLAAEDPDTKFGTLDETPLDGYIAAVELAATQIATVSQVPPHHLLGKMANMSAEALAAAESGLSRKVEEHKHSYGESWEQALRLARQLAGDAAAADDVKAQVDWRDMESRSLSQVADAIGKLADQAEIPPQMLWPRLPGWTRQNTDEALRLQAVRPPDPVRQMMDRLVEQGM